MKLSPATADHAIKFMRRALNLAVQWDYLDKKRPHGHYPYFPWLTKCRQIPAFAAVADLFFSKADNSNFRRFGNQLYE